MHCLSQGFRSSAAIQIQSSISFFNGGIWYLSSLSDRVGMIRLHGIIISAAWLGGVQSDSGRWRLGG